MSLVASAEMLPDAMAPIWSVVSAAVWSVESAASKAEPRPETAAGLKAATWSVDKAERSCVVSTRACACVSPPTYPIVSAAI